MKFLSWILFFVFIWFVPDLYMFSKNGANYLFNEATVTPAIQIEVKPVERIPRIPDRFATIMPGKKDVHVQLIDDEKEKAYSMSTDDGGTALFINIPPAEYRIVVGKVMSELSTEDIETLNARGESIFDEKDIIPSNLEKIKVDKNVYIVPVLK